MQFQTILIASDYKSLELCQASNYWSSIFIGLPLQR